MAVTVERLIATLEARFDQYDKQLNRALGNTNRTFGRIEARGKQLERRMSQMGANFGASLTRAFAIAGGIRGFQTLIDSATRIDNALKVAGLSGTELEKVYSRLRDSAIKNAAPLETLVTLYGRAALVQKELNVSQEEMLNFTDKVAVALRVAGTDAQSASGALLQLSQALGSGVVRAEEFNSILEGALPIAQAAAAGLREAGGSVAALRQLVVDGQVSSEAFFRAFEAGAVILDQKVAGATLTVQQGLTNVRTALIDATRDFAKGSMAAESLGDAFAQMADAINSINFEAFGQQVAQLLGWINQIREALGFLQTLGVNIGKATGLDAIGDWATGGEAFKSFGGGALTITNQRGVQRRIDDAFAGIVETTTQQAEGAIVRAAEAATTPKTGRLPSAEVSTVSLADFAPPASRGGSGGGRGGGGGGRGGAGGRADEYERLAQRIRETTAELQAETSAMAGLNPLVNDHGFALEKARTTQELLNAAQRAGIAITPELKASIDQLAEGYANASAEAQKLAEAQDQARQSAEEMKSLGKDVIKGFISDLRNGKSAAEALANALDKVIDKLLDMALNALFDGLGGGLGGGKGGLFGGAIIPGILHKGGVAGRDGYGHGRAVSPSVFANAPRYHRGGIAGLRPGEVPAILQRGEVVIPKGGKAGGGGVSVRYFDQAGVRVQTQVRESNGNVDIRATIQQIAAEGAMTRGSPLNNAIRTMGARAPLKTR